VEPDPGARVRERRGQCGLTQAELATRAGVSRQLVAALEAGRNTPAVDAALRIARALGTSVEELFASTAPPSPVAVLGGRLPDRVPLRVGRVGERLVAAVLPDGGASGAGWARPDGVCEGGGLRLFAGARTDGLVVAGCDGALGVAEAMLDGLGARSLLAVPATTRAAVAALARGTVHAAVVHGRQGELPAPPVPVQRLHVARWRVGLGVGAPVRCGSLEALLRSRTPIVQRDGGAASQRAFERAATLQGLSAPPAARLATGHIDAARVAALLRAAAVTNEPAAAAFGLRFLALEEHTVQLWVAERWREHPGAIALGELLVTRAFTERVGQFGGYDLGECGAPATSGR